MTEVDATRGAAPEASGTDAWSAYLAAAQRLDAVRRGTQSAEAERARVVQAARQELEQVRRRLAVQRSALPSRGVPDNELTPTPAELAAATAAMSGGPTAVLAAVRRARASADLADSAMVPGAAGGAAWPPWLRNLLVYGPFAAVVLLVQIVLYLVAGPDSVPGFALLCGLTMPVAAFGLGWLTVGLVFPAAPGGRVHRTPLVGALVCAAPVVVICMGVGVQAIVR